MKKVSSFFSSIFSLLKKDLHLYGAGIVSMLILLALLIVGCGVALGAVLVGADDSDKEKPLKMALYDKEPSSLGSSAIEAITDTDIVQSMFTIDICDTEEEVRNGMKSGLYDAGIVFEESYLHKILNGDDAGVTVLISDKLNMASDILSHFALSGEEIIKIAESGVEAAYEYIKEEYPDIKPSDITNPMQINYALEIFSLPHEMLNYEEVPYSSSGLDLKGYYLVCFCVFLLLLCEVLFFPYMAKDLSHAMLCRIKSYKIANAAIIIEKAIIPFFIRLGLTCAIVLFIKDAINADLSFANIANAVCFLALISICMSALSALLSQTPLGISIIFALSFACLVLCGGLIPSAMLPHEMISIGKWTPLGFGIKMLAPLFGGVTTQNTGIILLFITVILTLAASLYMRRICKKGGAK